MPVKGNQFKSNSFKEDNEPRQSSKSEKEKYVKPKVEKVPRESFDNSKLIKIAGLFFLILSVFFLVAFTSYLFTWQQDQSYVSHANGGWHNLFKTNQELVDNGIKNPVVENWLGKFGALLSDQFIYEWFGISSFIFIFVFFVIGYRFLFKVRLFSISRTLAYSFFCIIFFSVTIGFFHGLIDDYPHFLEGEFGYWSNILLYPQWHAYFRRYQPPTLVTWGKGDQVFAVEGASAYRKDIPDAEVHILSAGHFALETHAGAIAGYIRDFLSRH